MKIILRETGCFIDYKNCDHSLFWTPLYVQYEQHHLHNDNDNAKRTNKTLIIYSVVVKRKCLRKLNFSKKKQKSPLPYITLLRNIHSKVARNYEKNYILCALRITHLLNNGFKFFRKLISWNQFGFIKQNFKWVQKFLSNHVSRVYLKMKFFVFYFHLFHIEIKFIH